MVLLTQCPVFRSPLNLFFQIVKCASAVAIINDPKVFIKQCTVCLRSWDTVVTFFQILKCVTRQYKVTFLGLLSGIVWHRGLHWYGDGGKLDNFPPLLRSKSCCGYFVLIYFLQIVSLLYETLLVVFTENSDQLAQGLTRFLLKKRTQGF